MRLTITTPLPPKRQRTNEKRAISVVESRSTAVMTPFDAAKPRSKTKTPAMSLEQALFEEEQEVLALIGAKTDTLPPPPTTYRRKQKWKRIKVKYVGTQWYSQYSQQ